ncbi:MAG: glycosyltransferase family 2 protein [Saprospiraceae bacterium]
MATYLEKNALFPQLINVPVPENLGMVVVIPCYDETELIRSLESLKNCDAANCFTEVIVVVNDGEQTSGEIKSQNLVTFEMATTWSKENITKHLQFHIIYKTNLPKKIAGVGTARKIGMDEAVRRLESVGKSEGVIICFDADSLCEKNYLQTIEEHFLENPKVQSCGIHFEHPLEGDNYEPEIYDAITKYELHLRYYIHAQKFAGFPLAFQTIGSSMAVRCNAYQQQGGMNKKKAGEDFYFLHKFTILNAHTELKKTKTIPSPRRSDRVPFGTGKAVNEILAEKRLAPETKYSTYNFKIFEDLEPFLTVAPNLLLFENEQVEMMKKHLPESIRTFLDANNFDTKLAEIQANTTIPITFGGRFFRWFNAFFLMKYVHFARDNYYPNVPVEEAARALLQKYYFKDMSGASAKELLLEFRKKDLSQLF